MKKLFMLLALSAFAVGCASGPNRGPASSDPACSLEKHPSQPHYRVLVGEKPYNSYWYKHQDPMSLMNKFVQKGKCSGQ